MKQTIKGFADLAVYQKAYRVSLDIHAKTLKFPRHEQVRGIGDQMRSASKGICANIAEGYGKQSISKAEFCRFLLMAIGSADEMRVWARYALDLGYIDQGQWGSWSHEYRDIAKMLTGLHKSWST